MHTKANVIILYINEKYLISDHNIYYAIMQEVINVIN